MRMGVLCLLRPEIPVYAAGVYAVLLRLGGRNIQVDQMPRKL